MELDYNPFWFTVLMLVGFFFIGLSIFFAFQLAYSDDVLTYDECVDLFDEDTCNYIVPPLPFQQV